MIEAKGRAEYEAELEESGVIEPEQLEKVALSMMLDF